MNKIATFIHEWRSDGINEPLISTLSFLFSLDKRKLKNALKFRSPRILFSCDIEQVLPESTLLGHPVGIVVGGTAEIGENVNIHQNITIGQRGAYHPKSHPVIEDNVVIWSGAVIAGNVRLGEGCVIGANSVVLEDVEEGRTAVGVPASEVEK